MSGNRLNGRWTGPAAAALAAVPVCVDGRMLGEGGTGVSHYARNLVAALEGGGRAPLRLVDDYVARPTRKTAMERWLRWLRAWGRGGIRLHAEGSGLYAPDIFRLSQVRFDRQGGLLRLRPPFAGGVMHWTYPLPIRMEGWANVYTLHDAIPLTHPALTPIDAGRHRRLLTAIASTAEALVTVSDDAARRLEQALSLPAGAVVNCGQAVADPPLAADPPLPAGLAPDGYFLFVGSIEPRKNVAALVSAWRAAGTSLPLVLAGPSGWRAGATLPMPLPPGLMRLEYLPAPQLAALRRHARALLFPSLTEGFGMPIVEAQAAGTAVLTAAGGATEEVAGGAALLVDPLDGAAIAAGIARLAADDALVADLALRGRARADNFTPDRFAARLAAVHARAIASLGKPAYAAAPGYGE